jgi:hypothetical protein
MKPQCPKLKLITEQRRTTALSELEANEAVTSEASKNE